MADRITDDHLKSICELEVAATAGFSTSELAAERSDAMDRFLGNGGPAAAEGRSAAKSRLVTETVLSHLPGLMRIFTERKNLVKFEPSGADDVEAAEAETDAVSYWFWQRNPGFLTTLSCCFDALLSKTAVLKVWWEDAPDQKREDYDRISQIQLRGLLQDPHFEREAIEAELHEDGTINVSFSATPRDGKLCFAAVTPEHFGVNPDMGTPDLQEARFVWHSEERTRSDLVEDGVPDEIIEKINWNANADLSEEGLSRDDIDEEQRTYREEAHESMRTCWVTECYPLLDRDGDGIAERLKIRLAGDAPTASGVGFSGTQLLDVEVVDGRHPFFSATAVMVPHRFYGLSLADLVNDLEDIDTALWRGALDNIRYSQNTRTAASEDDVILSDLTTSRPGGVVRTLNGKSPGEVLMPLSGTTLPTDTWQLFDLLQARATRRTGAGDEVPGLDAAALSNVNTGVAALAADATRAKQELIARLMAELMFAPAFCHAHELLRKHSRVPVSMETGGQWADTNPGDWAARTNYTPMVGMGQASKERRLLALDAVLTRQAQALESGGMGLVLNAENVYSALTEWTEELGLPDARRYWLNPAQAQPPQQEEGPDPQMAAVQAQLQLGQMQAKVQGDRNQIEAAKAQAAAQKGQAELQLKSQQMQIDEREAASKADLERMKTELAAAKAEAELSESEMEAAVQAELKSQEQELREREAAVKAELEQAKMQVDLLKASLAAGTQLTMEQMRAAGVPGIEEPAPMAEDAGEAVVDHVPELVAQLFEEIQALKAPRGPRLIEYDDDDVVVSIGGEGVTRDAAGRPVSIG